MGETNVIVELSTGKELLRTEKKIVDICTEDKELWMVRSGTNAEQYCYTEGSLQKYFASESEKTSEQEIPEVINREKYEEMKQIRGGFFPAKISGKWGIFHIDGRCIVPAEYDDIRHSSEM